VLSEHDVDAIANAIPDTDTVASLLTSHVLPKHGSKEAAAANPGVGKHTYFRKGGARLSGEAKGEKVARQAARTMSSDEIYALILDAIQNPDEVWETSIGPSDDPSTTARALYFKNFGKAIGRDRSMGKVAAVAGGYRANEVTSLSVVVARTVCFQTVMVKVPGMVSPVVGYQTEYAPVFTPTGMFTVPRSVPVYGSPVPGWIDEPQLESYYSLAIVSAYPAKNPSGINQIV
jgi:hypothetical protein